MLIFFSSIVHHQLWAQIIKSREFYNYNPRVYAPKQSELLYTLIICDKKIKYPHLSHHNAFLLFSHKAQDMYHPSSLYAKYRLLHLRKKSASHLKEEKILSPFQPYFMFGKVRKEQQITSDTSFWHAICYTYTYIHFTSLQYVFLMLTEILW